MIPGERRRHACMEGGAQRESAIGWKTEASGRTEGRAGRRRPGEERGGAMLAWKAAHSGNRPSVGKPKLPAGPKGVPEDAVREKSGAAASCLPR